MAVRQRTHTAMHAIEAPPTTKVIAISVGLNVPVTIRVQPKRNSQMNAMIVSQKIMQGSADHFAHSFF